MQEHRLPDIVYEKGHIREKRVAWLPDLYIIDEVFNLSFVIFKVFFRWRAY